VDTADEAHPIGIAIHYSLHERDEGDHRFGSDGSAGMSLRRPTCFRAPRPRAATGWLELEIRNVKHVELTSQRERNKLLLGQVAGLQGRNRAEERQAVRDDANAAKEAAKQAKRASTQRLIRRRLLG
jgi:hypothetical protein